MATLQSWNYQITLLRKRQTNPTGNVDLKKSLLVRVKLTLFQDLHMAQI